MEKNKKIVPVWFFVLILVVVMAAPFISKGINQWRKRDDPFKQIQIYRERALRGGFEPDIDLKDMGSHYWLQMILSKDIITDTLKAKIKDRYLAVTAKYFSERKGAEGGSRWSSTSRGSIERRTLLPWNIKAYEAKAKFYDNVLEVTMPKCGIFRKLIEILSRNKDDKESEFEIHIEF